MLENCLFLCCFSTVFRCSAPQRCLCPQAVPRFHLFNLTVMVHYLFFFFTVCDVKPEFSMTLFPVFEDAFWKPCT